MPMTTSFKQESKGFTIVELMIATMVFATVLLVITSGIIQFTRSYYRGATVAKTQDTARSIIDSVSQSIQFGSALPSDMYASGSPQYFCAGGYQFIFNKGTKYDSVQSPTYTNPGLYLVQSMNGCNAPSNPLPIGGRQLLNSNMRVTQLTQTFLGNGLYSVSVTVAYGDDDLLCDGGEPATCQPNAPVLTPTAFASVSSDIRCRLTQGSEFCAVSTLSTIVKKRIQ